VNVFYLIYSNWSLLSLCAVNKPQREWDDLKFNFWFIGFEGTGANASANNHNHIPPTGTNFKRQNTVDSATIKDKSTAANAGNTSSANRPGSTIPKTGNTSNLDVPGK